MLPTREEREEMRAKWFNMRMSKEELAELKKDAGKVGMSVAVFLRYLLLKWRTDWKQGNKNS